MDFKHHKCPPHMHKDMIGPRVNYLSKLMHMEFNRAIANQGLFSGQHDIVFALLGNEGITLSALAKMLDISAATVSVSIKRMEKSGFIIKRQDDNDTRITRLYLTEKAKKAPENIKREMDSLEAVIKDGMTDVQAKELARLLETASQNMLRRGDNE